VLFLSSLPALEPITEEQLNDLLGKEMYLITFDLRGNKVKIKRDYSKKKRKEKIARESPTSTEHQ